MLYYNDFKKISLKNGGDAKKTNELKLFFKCKYGTYILILH